MCRGGREESRPYNLLIYCVLHAVLRALPVLARNRRGGLPNEPSGLRLVYALQEIEASVGGILWEAGRCIQF